ncbi:MAG: ATP-binding protein [Caldisericaceae bacterium]
MSFKDIKGQEAAVNYLRRIVEKRTIPPTLIFSGPKGTGRKFAAITFAKALNCKNAFGDSCDHCETCRAIDANVHPNILILDGNGKAIGIDDIRNVIDSSFIPINDGVKVNILDGLDNATEEAFNSMLKYFEEPPENTVNIIIVENADNLPETVKSRSVEIKFKSLTLEVIRELLAAKGLDEATINSISQLMGGSMDQLKQYLDKEVLSKRNILIETTLAFLANERSAAELIEAIKGFYGRDISRESLSLYLEELLKVVSDILLVSMSREPDRIVNVDFLGYIANKFYTFDMKKIYRIFSVIEKSKKSLLTNANPNYIVFYTVFGISQIVS